MDESKVSVGLKDVTPKSKRLPRRKGKKVVGVRPQVERKRPAELSPAEEARRKKAKQYRDAAKAKAAEKILIGLDFGTTYLGVAYGTSMMQLKDVEVLSSWTGGANDTEEKAPSRIAYAMENERLTSDVWGYGIKVGLAYICQWVKLLLDASTKKPLVDLCYTYRNPKTVVTDLLALVNAHVMEQLHKQIGRTAVEQTAIRVAVTVPATWSLAARLATKQAAQDAGFANGKRDEMVVVEEPEAASLWAIKSAAPSLLSKTFLTGTTMTSLDLGGGTLDSVSYEIVSLDPLQLEEACVGQGAKMGATAIDRQLHVMMEKRFGEAFTCLPSEKTSAGSAFMKAFEEIKRNFEGEEQSQDTEWIHLKMKMLDQRRTELHEVYDFSEDIVKITSDDLVTMFEPVLQSGFSLLEKQVERIREAGSPEMRTLVLVGGLSCNIYVFNRISRFVEEFFGAGKVTVVNPRRPWSAVCRGAVIHSFEKSAVMLRRSRDWIGTVVDEKFSVKKHNREDLFRCPELGDRARNQMSWAVERNKQLAVNQKNRIDCWAVAHNTRHEIVSACVDQVLYRCPLKDPPSRFDESVVSKIGTISMDITEIAQERREQYKELEGRYPENLPIHVILEIIVSSMKGVMEVSARVDHKKVGKTTIEYFSDPAWKAGLVQDDGRDKSVDTRQESVTSNGDEGEDEDEDE